MKVLLVSPYLAPDGGGLERYAHELARHLARDGHDVTQLAYGAHASYEYNLGWRRIAAPWTLRVSNTPVGVALHHEARELLRRERFDVVNAHTPVPGAAEWASLAARAARVPFVVTYHAGRLAGGSAALDAVAFAHRATFERAMLGGAQGRIAVSRYVQERAFAGMPSALVPPGVDTARFREVAPRDPGRILYVGPVSRAYAWKGFADLFEAFARLASRVPHAKLRAVGGGDLVQHYLGEAAKRGLAHRVSFMGRVADDALPREYSRAEVVALPSTSEAESFGMVLAEANACERPVVGTRVGGIPHFVRDGENGLLVEPRDPDGLAVALERLLHEPDHARRLARAGHERVLREHRWSELAHRTVEVYEAAHARALARPSALARAPDA